MVQNLKVAVIGAGVGGLVTARELQREGHQVVVFERLEKIGGTWLYTPQIEDEDLLGLNPNRKKVHSSLYNSLRTNLPIQVMGFSDYPYSRNQDRYKNPPTNFPSHQEVLEFLNDFVRDFGLNELIRFNVEVVRVEQQNSGGGGKKWVVGWRSAVNGGGGEVSEEVFDAVVVATGHYTQPKLADFPGLKKWPGKQIHCHNFRVPEPFKDQVVVVVGSGPSAKDIALDVSKVAKEVHVSGRDPEIKPSKLLDNMWQHTNIKYCHENGYITFDDGASVAADVLLLCTGYKHELPFLNTNGVVTADNNRVGPLYKHIFPPELAPHLSFIGIPNRAVSFPTLEAQGRWVAYAISGKVKLPSKEEMLASVEEYYRTLEKNGVPKHHTHSLPLGFEYVDWLTAQVGKPSVDEQAKEMAIAAVKNLRGGWVGYRDRLDAWIGQVLSKIDPKAEQKKATPTNQILQSRL